MVTTGLGELVVRHIGQGGQSPIVGGAPSAPGMSGGGGDNAAKEQVGVLQKIRDSAGKQAEGMKNQPRWWTKALKTMGIQMGIAGILKQSQIFTSTLGSLFQILGAFVDVMLAPWMPVIIPAIRKLANQVPRMREIGQKFFDSVMALPWGAIGKAGSLILKAMQPSWWANILNTALGGIYAWVLRQLSHVWNFLPGWMKGENNPFDEQLALMGEKTDAQTKAITDGTAENKSWMEKIHLGIGGLAATWVTAKAARYGLQLTRWIPFVKEFTEPVRWLSKGIDRLFNKTAQMIGKGFLGVGKSLANQIWKLMGKDVPFPKGPKGVTDVRGGGDADDAWRRGIKPTGRPTGRGRGMVDADDAWKPKGKGGRGVDIDRYRKNYDDIVWDDGSKGRTTAGSIAQEAGDSFDKPGAKESKIGKAAKQLRKFQAWLGPNTKSIMRYAALGQMDRVKATAQAGMQLASTTLRMAAGTPVGRTVARLAVGFLKILPFLGAAYMGMETTFDLNKIRKSEKGWVGDVGSVDAWMKEGKGMLASMLGEGSMGKFVGPLAGVNWAMKAASNIPGVGDFFKGGTDTLKRWKEAQAEGGALSSGKALDFGIRAITGYGGAGASFLPLLGQMIGGAAYEGGKYTSMGQFMDMERTGTAKYGEGSFAEASIDKIMQMFNGMTVNMAVDGAQATAGMGDNL